MALAEDEVDWSTRPKAGWGEFSALRAAFLDRLRIQAEVTRLENAWRAPSAPQPRRRPATGGRAATG